MTFHLVGALNLRLAFEAMEFGDESHAPPASPFSETENFDGVDDQINLGTAVDGALGAEQDFAIAFWWARGVGNDEGGKHIFYSASDNGQIFAYNNNTGSLYTPFSVFRSNSPVDRVDLVIYNVGYDWNHFVLQRRGDTIELWWNGALAQSNTNAANTREFMSTSGFLLGSP